MKKLFFFLYFIPLVSFGQDSFLEKYNNTVWTDGEKSIIFRNLSSIEYRESKEPVRGYVFDGFLKKSTDNIKLYNDPGYFIIIDSVQNTKNIYTINTKSGINVRDYPGSSGNVVGKLMNGIAVNVLSETENMLTINDVDRETGESRKISGKWVEIETYSPLSGHRQEAFPDNNGLWYYTKKIEDPGRLECHMCGYKAIIDNFIFNEENTLNRLSFVLDVTGDYGPGEYSKHTFEIHPSSAEKDAMVEIKNYNDYYDQVSSQRVWIQINSNSVEIERIKNINKPKEYSQKELDSISLREIEVRALVEEEVDIDEAEYYFSNDANLIENPQSAGNFYNNGLVKLFRFQNYNGAIEDLNTAIKINDDQDEEWWIKFAYFFRGIAKGKLNLEEVREDWEKAASLGLYHAKKAIRENGYREIKIKDKGVNKLAGTDFLIDFSERWKKAYEGINWSSDWSWGLEYGFRSKYKIANSILNQDTNIINVLSEIFTTPVFIRGPHLNGMNFGDKTSFGYYNPEFIEKLTVITNELLDNSIYKELLRPIYKNYLSEMAYAYKAAYELFKSYKMDNPNRLEDATRNYLYQISIGDETGEDVFGVLSQLETHYYPKEYDYYNLSGRGANIRDYDNFITAINFWGRRDIDGTFEKIGELLNLVMDKLETDSYTLSKDKDVNNFPGTDSYYISTEGESKIYNYDSYQITTTDLYDAGFGELYGEQIKIFYKDGESIELTIGMGEYTGNNEEILFRGVIQNYMIIIEGGISAPSDNGFRVFDLKNKKYVFEGAFYDEYKIVNSKIEFYNVIDHPYYPNYAESYGKFTKPKCSSELDALSKQYPGSIGYVEKLIYDIATQQLERTGIYKCAYFQ